MYEVFDADGKFVLATDRILEAIKSAKKYGGWFAENPELRKERWCD